jgi:hypothetical protein
MGSGCRRDLTSRPLSRISLLISDDRAGAIHRISYRSSD